MAWIATAASVGLGLYSANKQSNAADEANRQNMAGFEQYKPYTDKALEGGQAANDARLAAGFYGGPTYAGPNGYQTGAATGYGDASMGIMNRGFDMAGANAGFGANARGLYDQYQGMANGVSAQGRMDTANQYAMDNMNPLVNAAMRDDRRNLQENTLTGIDLAASGTNNMNSSRAGVAEAVANRGYDDRRADVRSQVMDSLRTQSLNQQNQQFVDQSNALTNAGNANTAISNAYNSGMNTLGEGANFGMNAGNALQGYDQSALNDQQAAFERQRDFELQQRQGFQSGILGKAPSSPTVTPNLYNGVQGAISGGMQGFGFANQYAQQQRQNAQAQNAWAQANFSPPNYNFGG